MCRSVAGNISIELTTESHATKWLWSLLPKTILPTQFMAISKDPLLLISCFNSKIKFYQKGHWCQKLWLVLKCWLLQKVEDPALSIDHITCVDCLLTWPFLQNYSQKYFCDRAMNQWLFWLIVNVAGNISEVTRELGTRN